VTGQTEPGLVALYDIWLNPGDQREPGIKQLTDIGRTWICPTLYLHFNGHFPGEPGLAAVFEATDDGGGGNNWSYMWCKAPVKSSPPTDQHPVFYRLDALPVAQPTMSKHWREWISCEYLVL